MTSQSEMQTITIHILLNILRSKGNHSMNFGQLMKYNMGKCFFKSHAENETWRVVPDFFLFFKRAYIR